MLYRREIDGIRAVAVLPVILFHAGFDVFKGGYAGVDVFFVVSGYLITSLLLSDLENGQFSTLRFYERRARRLLPALFLMLFITIPFAWAWMMPPQFQKFGESLMSVVIFGSNITEWRDLGYFQGNAQLKPLLHTWSLAVEEQYYLLFPSFLAMVWRFGRKVAGWLVVACIVASFALCIWGSLNSPVANFYLLPSRAWEILMGSACALFRLDRMVRENDLLSSLGLAAILGSVVFLNEKMPFPSHLTLPPVVGTCMLIIFAGPTGYIGRLLGNPVLVGIGVTSYSAYLWHFPLFAFARLQAIDEPEIPILLALTVVSFFIAALSWYFVEQPFRSGASDTLPDRRSFFLAAASCTAIIFVVGFVIDRAQGVPARLAPEKIVTIEAANHGLDPKCSQGFTLDAACRTSHKPEMVVWGDSYAMHLISGVLATEKGLGLQQHTAVGCPPIFDLTSMGRYPAASRNFALSCDHFNKQVIDWLASNPSVKYVIMSSRFSLVEYPVKYQKSGHLSKLRDMEILVENFQKTIDKLHSMGLKVILFSPTPENGRDFGMCVAKAAFFGFTRDRCDFALNASVKNRENILFVTKLQQRIPVVQLAPLICPDSNCLVSREGILLYRDYGHLTVKGSAYLGRKYGWSSLIRQNAR